MTSRLEKIEGFLTEFKEIDKAVGLPAQKAKYITLYEKVLNFVRIVLKDEMRVKELEGVNSHRVIITNYMSDTKIAIQEQKNFQYKKGNLLRIVMALRDAIKLEDEFKEERKIDNATEEIEKAKKEAERRGAVVESKSFGAIIELLDMQRQELKRRINIEERLTKIEQSLTLILKKLDGKNN